MLASGPAPCDQAVLRQGDARVACAEAARPYVLATAVLGSSMAFIDGTVLNVALPAIQDGLGASAAELQWIVNAYMLLLGSLLLIGGAAGDRFGRKRVFAQGVVLFAAASAVCGFAPDSTTLIAARAVQGIGAALLVPGSLALVSANFPQEVRGRAIGTWAGFAALTTAAGPLLGGWMIDVLSWRSIFFLNLPVAAVTLALAARFVPESRDQDARASPLDWAGAVLAVLALAALTFGFTAAGERSLAAPAALGGVALGVVLLLAFLLREAQAPAPMMPLGLFRSRTFSGANLLTLLLYFALSGVLFLLPFNLIQVHGYSALGVGAAFLPFTAVMGLMSRWAGGLVERFGARWPLILGPLITAGGFAALALPGTSGSYWTTFFPAMLLLGIGMTISVAPLTTAVMNAVDERHTGTASGINNAASRIAGLLAVALLGALAFGLFEPALAERLAGLDLPAATRASILEQSRALVSLEPPATLDRATAAAVRAAVEQAFVEGFRTVMLATAAAAAASAMVAAAAIRGRPATAAA
jgi:EmrB/QacA subfamily drug resistance transporter